MTKKGWIGIQGQVTSKGFRNQIPTKAGVYILSSHLPNGKPKEIGRAARIDKNGILYIGEATNLNERLGALRQTLMETYEAEPHTAGRRYNQIKSMRKRFPKGTLRVTYKVVKTHKASESKLLSEYEQTYGELPPLNRMN